MMIHMRLLLCIFSLQCCFQQLRGTVQEIPLEFVVREYTQTIPPDENAEETYASSYTPKVTTTQTLSATIVLENYRTEPIYYMLTSNAPAYEERILTDRRTTKNVAKYLGENAWYNLPALSRIEETIHGEIQLLILATSIDHLKTARTLLLKNGIEGLMKTASSHWLVIAFNGIILKESAKPLYIALLPGTEVRESLVQTRNSPKIQGQSYHTLTSSNHHKNKFS